MIIFIHQQDWRVKFGLKIPNRWGKTVRKS